MIRYTYDKSSRTLIQEDAQTNGLVVPDGCGCLMSDAVLFFGDPPQPKRLTDALEVVRKAGYRTVSAWKSHQQAGGFEYQGRVLHSDDKSLIRFSGGIEAAQLAIQSQQPFQITWTVYSGKAIVCDAIGMIALAVASKEHISYYHALAIATEAHIENADTIEEILAVTESLDWSTLIPHQA